jgi:hypothetical protein
VEDNDLKKETKAGIRKKGINQNLPVPSAFIPAEETNDVNVINKTKRAAVTTQEVIILLVAADISSR